MIENDDNLLNDFENKYLNKKRRYFKYCQILSLIFILISIITIITFIIIFISDKKNTDEEQKEAKEKEINEIKKEIDEREKVINEKDKEIKEREKQITDKEVEIKEKEKIIKEKEMQITEKEKELKEKDKIIIDKEKIITEKEKKIIEKEKQITEKEIEIKDKEKQITEKEIEIKDKDKAIIEKEKVLVEKEKLISDRENQIIDKEIELEEKEKIIIDKEKLISDKEIQIKEREKKIKENENIIIDKENQLAEKEKQIAEKEKQIKDKEKEIEELSNHPYLDTIPDEELKQARNSFNQNIFINPVNSKITLPYNFFIPENYTSNIIYPLIVFIGDESTFGKETILPINKTIGGPIWATRTIQKKYKCFVLVPHFTENVFNNNDESLKKEYLSMIIELIYKIKNEYNIDLNRIYGTGQSIGAEAILYLIIKNLNIFAGSLIIDPINVNKNLISSNNTPFTYFSSKEYNISLNTQNDIKNYFISSKIEFNTITDINPQENITILNQNINNNLYIKEYKFNFITYSNRIDYQKNNNKNEIYKYGYRPDAVREWLFSQNKIKCDKEYYYSEEKGKCFSRTKKKIFLISYTDGNLLQNLLKNKPFVSKVDIDNKDIISKITKNFLESYDCVIYDLKDGGTATDIKEEKEKEIRAYINSGGSFLVTHDKWDEDHGPLDLLGLYRWNDNNPSYSSSAKAKVSRFGHPIFDSYYNLTDWRVIEISKTHKSFHKIINSDTNTARVVMEFDKEIEIGYKLDYLTVNKVGKGRIAYWAAGHHYNISDYEKKLFINIVSWLTKNKQ